MTNVTYPYTKEGIEQAIAAVKLYFNNDYWDIISSNLASSNKLLLGIYFLKPLASNSNGTNSNPLIYVSTIPLDYINFINNNQILLLRNERLPLRKNSADDSELYDNIFNNSIISQPQYKNLTGVTVNISTNSTSTNDLIFIENLSDFKSPKKFNKNDINPDIGKPIPKDTSFINNNINNFTNNSTVSDFTRSQAISARNDLLGYLKRNIKSINKNMINTEYPSFTIKTISLAAPIGNFLREELTDSRIRIPVEVTLGLNTNELRQNPQLPLKVTNDILKEIRDLLVKYANYPKTPISTIKDREGNIYNIGFFSGPDSDVKVTGNDKGIFSIIIDQNYNKGKSKVNQFFTKLKPKDSSKFRQTMGANAWESLEKKDTLDFTLLKEAINKHQFN